jgi:hypothetical protein
MFMTEVLISSLVLQMTADRKAVEDLDKFEETLAGSK